MKVNSTRLLWVVQQFRRYYDRQFTDLLARSGLTMREMDVILFLTNNPGHDTARDVTELRGLSKSQVSAAVDLLAGIPSVVYGFFGLVVIVPFIRDNLSGRGLSLLAASVLLGIMILPTIVTVAQSALDAVPQKHYEGALALGADHERSVFRVVVPAASSGIMAGIVLGVGRAIGETMAVIMVAGNQTLIPASIFEGVRTMTANIVLEMGYSSGLHRQALFSIGLVLFVFIMIVNISFTIVSRRGVKIDGKE